VGAAIVVVRGDGVWMRRSLGERCGLAATAGSESSFAVFIWGGAARGLASLALRAATAALYKQRGRARKSCACWSVEQ